MEITAVVSNHEDVRTMVEQEGIPFHHLPVENGNYLPADNGAKRDQELRVQQIVESSGATLVILARYMQILSDEFSRYLSGRCINIHHSFLPSFKGAKPYHQAFERGVKVIGATAHYVTSDLDEGPIIDQVLSRVDHTYQPADLIEVGRQNESIALVNAVKLHLDGWVFLDGNKTVVLTNR